MFLTKTCPLHKVYCLTQVQVTQRRSKLVQDVCRVSLFLHYLIWIMPRLRPDHFTAQIGESSLFLRHQAALCWRNSPSPPNRKDLSFELQSFGGGCSCPEDAGISVYNRIHMTSTIWASLCPLQEGLEDLHDLM